MNQLVARVNGKNQNILI